MKYTTRALMMGTLRAEAGEEMGGLDGPAPDEVTDLGLLAGLDAFTDEVPEGGGDPDPEPEPEPELETEPEREPESTEEEEEEDIGLPEIGGSAEEPKKIEEEASFDPTKYDQDTDTIIAALEKAGHPGDVYKKLRAEVKAHKENAVASPALQAELDDLKTQNEALTEKAAQVDAMQDKVTAISSRNAELLLEENADFQERVTKPHQEIKETVTALAEAKDISEKELWDVIMQNDPVKRMTAVDALEEKIGGRHALMVDKISTDIRQISAIDKSMREDAVNIVAKAKESEVGMNAEAFEAKTKSFQTFTKSSFDQYADKIPGFTDDTGNMTDAARMAVGKAQTVDPNTLAPNDLGYMSFATQALPQALQEVRKLQRENRDLRVAAGGKGKNISTKTTQAKNPKDDQPKGMMDEFESMTFETAGVR